MSDHKETGYPERNLLRDDERIELKNGRFIDVVNGSYLSPDIRLVIRRGRIEHMPGIPGEPDDVSPDFTIDMKGKTVMPGLFNTHCHINVTATTLVPEIRDIRLGKKYAEQQKTVNMAECLARGITNIRDAYTANLRPNRALREKISRCEMAGPRLLQSVVVGPPGSYLAENHGYAVRFLRSVVGMPVFDHSRPEAGVVEFPLDATERQVRDAVDRAIDERGAQSIKIGEQIESIINFRPVSTIMKMEQLEALADQARRRGVKSMMHHVSVESFRRGVKAGVTSLSHIASDGALTQEDVDAFKAAGCITEPTVSVAYGITWKVKGHECHDHPDMNRLTEFRDITYTYADLAGEYFIPELRESVIRSHSKLARGKFKMLHVINISRAFRYYARSIYHGLENFRLLYRNGARMALANDGGVPPLTPAMTGFELTMFDFALNRESDSKQLTGAEAVRIATINSACSMGLEEDFGSIEVGKKADLLVIDGDPLQDYHLLGSRAAALFMDGRLALNNCGLSVEPVRES